MKDIARRSLLSLVGGGLAFGLAMRHGWAGVTGETPKRGGSLTATIGFPEPQAMFVPPGGGSSPAFTASKVLETLVRIEADLSFSPKLAVAWQASATHTQYILRLREDVRWHDGQAFTSKDVAFSIEHYWKRISAALALPTLASVEAPDATTVVLRFSAPYAETAFLYLLATNQILPAHLYADGNILTNPANNAPIGTGPWKFKRWVRGSHAEFTANRAYWNPGQPYLDQLVIRWWRDPASRAAALESGDLDIGVINPVPLSDIARLSQRKDLVVTRDGYAAIAFDASILYNLRNPIFAQRAVRQALLHAIDCHFLADTVYFGLAQPGIGPIATSNRLFFDPDVPRYEFNPAKAAKLLDQAGFPVKADGTRFPVKLVATGWVEENGKVGAYVKQMLDDLAIPTHLSVPDRPNSLKALYTDYDFDIAISQTGSGALEPVPRLTQLYTAAGIAKGIPFRNATGFSSPEMEALVDRLSLEADAQRRRDLVHQFARLAVIETPNFPLVELVTTTVARADVRDHSRSGDFANDGWGELWLAR